jgi:hypothetical protein
MSCEHTQAIGAELAIILGCGCAVTRVEPNQVVYDYDKLVDHFYKCEGMTDIEDADPRYVALEFVELNVLTQARELYPNPPAIELNGQIIS